MVTRPALYSDPFYDATVVVEVVIVVGKLEIGTYVGKRVSFLYFLILFRFHFLVFPFCSSSSVNQDSAVVCKSFSWTVVQVESYFLLFLWKSSAYRTVSTSNYLKRKRRHSFEAYRSPSFATVLALGCDTGIPQRCVYSDPVLLLHASKVDPRSFFSSSSTV